MQHYLKNKRYLSKLHYIIKMYVRKIKKEGKTYLYYYKSQRIGNKVKSIYVGRALEKPKKKKKEEKNNLKFLKNSETVNKLMEFDNLLFEINKSINSKDIKSSINIYNQMLKTYSEINIHKEDKEKLFNKINTIYTELIQLSQEHKISLE